MRVGIAAHIPPELHKREKAAADAAEALKKAHVAARRAERKAEKRRTAPLSSRESCSNSAGSPRALSTSSEKTSPLASSSGSAEGELPRAAA